jgi:hypothetical protein
MSVAEPRRMTGPRTIPASSTKPALIADPALSSRGPGLIRPGASLVRYHAPSMPVLAAELLASLSWFVHRNRPTYKTSVSKKNGPLTTSVDTLPMLGVKCSRVKSAKQESPQCVIQAASKDDRSASRKPIGVWSRCR